MGGKIPEEKYLRCHTKKNMKKYHGNCGSHFGKSLAITTRCFSLWRNI